MSICYTKSFQRAFGTYPLKGETLDTSLRAAIKVGYRAIDTAQMYKNEADIGAVIKTCGTDREEFCITTKVHPDNFQEDRFFDSVAQSLKALETSYVDLLLLHWPPVGGDIAPSLRMLEQAYRQGLTRNIGVSNYTCNMMRDAQTIISTPITTNQVEFHPLLNQQKLLDCATTLGIPLSSYCSLARGKIIQHPELVEIGRMYGKTTAQVALRWILQKGVSLNTMSSKEDNIKNNFDIMDFTLSNVDLARVTAITKNGCRLVTRNIAPWAPEWDD